MQEYLIKLLRQEDGKWMLTGHWMIGKDNQGRKNWNMDGAPLYFNTRKEAINHLEVAGGVPD